MKRKNKREDIKKGIKPTACYNDKGILRKWFANYYDAEIYQFKNGGTIHQFRNMNELYEHLMGL